jgi:hypothetical protein
MLTKHHIIAGVGVVAAITGAVLFSHHRAGPDYYYPPSDVTGVTNPSVTQANIQQTICVSGWTATIRPPSSYTTTLKKKQEQQYGLATTTGEEEDHFISLELGGNPTDPHNLWPESYPLAHAKDQAENYLHRQVCSGKMSLAEAQKEITSDWYAVYMAQLQGSVGAIGYPQDSVDVDDE